MALTADTQTRLGYALTGSAAATELAAAITTAGAGTLIGAATVTNAMLAASALQPIVKTATAALGYAVGAGAAITQITSRATGVVCSGLSGAITTDTSSLAGLAGATMIVTNTSVAIGDVVILSVRSGFNGGNTNAYVSAVAAGSFSITVANGNAAAGTAETGAGIINFAVIKAVST